MTADKIAKRGTPLTDAEFDGLDNSGAELCRRLEQDRAALMEDANELSTAIQIAMSESEVSKAGFLPSLKQMIETLAAVRSRHG